MHFPIALLILNLFSLQSNTLYSERTCPNSRHTSIILTCHSGGSTDISVLPGCLGLIPNTKQDNIPVVWMQDFFKGGSVAACMCKNFRSHTHF